MTNLQNRSSEKELLDQLGIPFEDIKINLEELNKINSYLGGHYISGRGLEILVSDKSHSLTICEIGCGGGDNIIYLDRWCRSRNIPAQFIGVDINKDCIDFAREQAGNIDATWIVSDYAKVEFETKPSIIFSSLFCHHFSNNDLVKMVIWMKNHCKVGFFINDLHRHQLAYYSIRFLTRFFSKSYLVKHDAPLSVARGFRKQELEEIFEKAGLSGFSVRWMWAFRYLIVYKK